MARISENNVSFQEHQILRRNVLNIAESKTKGPPIFLPQMNLKETSTKNETDEICQQPSGRIELDVRGLGVKTDGKDFNKRTRRKQKRTRKHKTKVSSFVSPSNEIAALKIPGFSLPPIDSKSLAHNPAKTNESGRPSTTGITPQQEFEIAFTTLMSVIERSKEEQKRTAERFRRNLVQGEQKPINEKLQSPWPGEEKSDCSPDRCGTKM